MISTPSDELVAQRERSRSASRWIGGGWLLILAVGLPVIVSPGTFFGSFSGAPVLMREWMWVTSTLMRGFQFLGIVLVVAGLVRSPSASGMGRPLAIGLHGSAGLLVAIGLIAPLILREGPWEPFAFEPTLLRHLAFAPAVLLGAALAAASVSISKSRTIGVAGAAFGVAGALSATFSWFSTPQALLPRPLEGFGHPASALIWVGGFVCLLWATIEHSKRDSDG